MLELIFFSIFLFISSDKALISIVVFTGPDTGSCFISGCDGKYSSIFLL
jgi:hypothetical protein